MSLLLKAIIYLIFIGLFPKMKNQAKIRTIKYFWTLKICLIHAVPLIRNAVKNGLVLDFEICTVVSYFFVSLWDSRFLHIFKSGWFFQNYNCNLYRNREAGVYYKYLGFWDWSCTNFHKLVLKNTSASYLFSKFWNILRRCFFGL